MTLDAQIETILFWRGEPTEIARLAEILKVTEEEIQIALTVLEEKLHDRGVELIRNNGEVTLGTQRDMGPVIERLTKDELMKDLGKAGLETLSIILYRGPVTRRDIDYIRGVNSQFVLRNLLIRGLIERVQNPEDQRTFIYKPTFELLSYLGVSSVEELPEYSDVRKELEAHKDKPEEKQE